MSKQARHPNRRQRRSAKYRYAKVHEHNNTEYRRARAGFEDVGSTETIRGLAKTVGVDAMEALVKRLSAIGTCLSVNTILREGADAMYLWHKRRKALEKALASRRIIQQSDLFFADASAYPIRIGLYGFREVAQDYLNRKVYAHCIVVDLPKNWDRSWTLNKTAGQLCRFTDQHLLRHHSNPNLRYIYPSGITQFLSRFRAYMREVKMEVPFSLRAFDEHGELQNAGSR